MFLFFVLFLVVLSFFLIYVLNNAKCQLAKMNVLIYLERFYVGHVKITYSGLKSQCIVFTNPIS